MSDTPSRVRPAADVQRRVRHGGALRLLAVGAVAVLPAACGGATGDEDDAAGLPTATTTDDASGADTSGMCAEGEPDCDDTVETGGDAGGEAGSCLAGDPDCTDESYGGQDVARPLPLSGEALVGEEAEVAATGGATGATLTGVHLLDDTTLQLGFGGDPCTVVEDVVVTESPSEVRILLLAGHPMDVDACIQSFVEYTTTVTLDEPLGDRAVLDLAG